MESLLSDYSVIIDLTQLLVLLLSYECSFVLFSTEHVVPMPPYVGCNNWKGYKAISVLCVEYSSFHIWYSFIPFILHV